MEVVDENGNGCPYVYTRNITNSSRHFDQLGQMFEQLHSLGVQRLSPAAYFDKCLYTSFHRDYRYNKCIHPLVNRMKSTPKNESPVVFVYDIEDVTMLTAHNLIELGSMIPEVEWNSLNEAIETVLSKVDYNEMYDSALTTEFKLFKQMYDDLSDCIDRKKSIISEELLRAAGIVEEEAKQTIRQIVVEHQKVFNQRWKSVEKCLKWTQKISKSPNKKYANVVLCKNTIARGAIELIFSRLSSTVPVENIFSTNADRFIDPVFKRIQKRFGEDCVLIHVTSKDNNYHLHGELQIPVWWLSSNESIEQLYKEQMNVLSKFP